MDCKKNVNIDLHIHSTASDGTFSPSEILAFAQQLNLGAISITDHDSIDGVKEALKNGIPASIHFLPGVEISAALPSGFSGSGSFHILGYGMRTDDVMLNNTLKKLQKAREDRNPQIISRLNKMGCNVSLNEVEERFKKKEIGRPHIACLMVDKGFAKSIDDAFDNYIAKGKPAYVDKYRIDCAEAVARIREAGGLPVLAHPVLLDVTSDSELEDLITELKKMGLKGIEAYYTDHSPQQTAQYIDLARRHQLLATGGSDFHGEVTPDVQMGSGKGDLSVPFEVYENIVKKMQQD